ncbi:MAG: hypothetical protein M0R39_14590 [Prolixibacteraceae bacterium]|nr:hypothetical protein [Prolixibacteraceae bacterium]
MERYFQDRIPVTNYVSISVRIGSNQQKRAMFERIGQTRIHDPMKGLKVGSESIDRDLNCRVSRYFGLLAIGY